MAEEASNVNRISLLPEELQIKIFNMLTVPEKGRCAMVCRAWRNTVYLPEFWRDFTLTWNEFGDESYFQYLCESLASKHIQRVKLMMYNAFEQDVMRDLSYVRLITRYLKHLTFLTLYQSEEPDEAMGLISRRLPKLANLELGYWFFITDTGMSYLAGHYGNVRYELPQLQSLKIDHSVELTDKAFTYLSSTQPYLERLYLNNAAQLTDSGLLFISTISRLEELKITGTANGITDFGLRRLVELKNLKALHLGEHQNITGSGFQYLSKMTSLHRLVIKGWGTYSESTWIHLSEIPNLRELVLSGVGLPDAGLRILCHSKSKITKLEIGFHNCVTDDGLKWLYRLTDLQELNLMPTSAVAGAGLAHLTKERSKLSILNLSGCVDLSIARCLRHFQKMKMLQLLILPNHIELTEVQKTQLSLALPHLHLTILRK